MSEPNLGMALWMAGTTILLININFMVWKLLNRREK